ncbi:tRNA-specific 2-thiouridylase MnmA [Geodia barretti]|uniref:tRNA-5-taurinomethyluridine 2-sulfurtransferase n=3 Tax=Geodia barretti TaxID=519541 RepID=A0AA35U1A9_GEOBA|nr:tRNA-specific 2-thiouridylase MnmA [Geodia barretti]
MNAMNDTPSPGSRVVVAMSGGVDSSVAALLLHQEGYEVIGVTMKLYDIDQADLPDYYRGCCTIDDVEDARAVCRILGVPHYVLNVQREFRTFVIDYFQSEYESGRTPHPCIACNDKIKFSFLAQRAQLMNATHVATGHYARIVAGGSGAWELLRGVDAGKDQSYVLFGMRQDQLASTLMPIGHYPKDDIRRLASDANFPNADKPDSQDICFIPTGDYREFLRQRTDEHPGDIVDPAGNVLGQHEGIQYFTVGQRRGLGLSGGPPRFVIRLEPDTRQVVVGSEEQLYGDSFYADPVSWVSGVPPTGELSVTVKIRYKFAEAPATVTPVGSGAVVRFHNPQRAITPGQAAVFYQGDSVLGGGVIAGGIPPESPEPAVGRTAPAHA